MNVTTWLTRAIVVALSGIAMAHADESSVAAETLLQQSASWNGTPYERYPDSAPQLTVLKITIPPHTALPWHSHPAPNAAYMLEGHLTIEDRSSGQKAVYRAGEAIAESVNTVHRGVTDDEPAIVLVVYAGTAGQPTSVPIEGGKPEY